MGIVVQEIAAGVWGAETSVSLGPGLALPLRMTVLRDRLGLVLISPIRIDDVLYERLSNWASRLLLKSVSRSFAQVEQSRLIRKYTNDRVAAGRSIEQLLTLPFTRVVPAHGEVIEVAAKQQLASGLWWMLGHSARA